jgi:hypothetical protein
MADEKRYVKLKWQTIASIARKATGLPYVSSDDYRYKNGVRCREDYRNGGVRVTYESGRYDRRSDVETKQARWDALDKMQAAFLAAGYEVDRTGGSMLTVTKEAPPAPPEKPFRRIRRERVCAFSVTDSRYTTESVALCRTFYRTHEGDFPTNEWIVSSPGIGAPEEAVFDNLVEAAERFAFHCQTEAHKAMLIAKERSPVQNPPTEEEIAAQTEVWEQEMRVYNLKYPGPMPEIASR